jgi:hypothetical protein
MIMWELQHIYYAICQVPKRECDQVIIKTCNNNTSITNYIDMHKQGTPQYIDRNFKSIQATNR